MTGQQITALALLLAFSLAGCIGGDAGTSSAANSSAAAPTFSEGAGAITGIVVDDSEAPIADAQVGLQGLPDLVTLTDGEGRFTLNNVPPGDQVILVNKLGFQAGVKRTAIVAEQIVEGVHIVLIPDEIPVAFPHLMTLNGNLGCSVRVYPGAPAGGAGGLAPGWYTGVAVCSLPGLAEATSDNFLLEWQTLKGAQEILLEMTWKTTQASGRGLAVALEDPDGINNGKPVYGTDAGVSPLVVNLNETRFLNVTEMLGRDCIKSACKFTTRVFAEANTTEYYLPAEIPPVGPFGKPRSKLDAGIVLNQAFTQYLTTFHNGPRKEGYTALSDQ